MQIIHLEFNLIIFASVKLFDDVLPECLVAEFKDASRVVGIVDDDVDGGAKPTGAGNCATLGVL